MNQFVTIKTFTFPHEVLVLRGRLESVGITCFVPDEQTIQMHPFYSNALGGVRLQVRIDDVEKANLILEDSGYEVLSKFKEAANEPSNVNNSDFGILAEKLQLRKLLMVIIVASIIITLLYYFMKEVELYN